jgi:hypothetical protein
MTTRRPSADAPPAPGRRTVPIEDAPHLVTGRPESPAPRRLTGDDYTTLLRGLGERNVVPFAALADAAAADADAIALRLDLTTGLTRTALDLAAREEQVGVHSLKALSLVAAGDLCVFSEGAPRVDPRTEPLLRALARGPSPRFAALNELADTVLAALACPWAVGEAIAAALAEWDLELGGLATPVGDGPADRLNLLLLHGSGGRAPAAVLAEYGFEAPELTFPKTPREHLAGDHDLVRDLVVEPGPERRTYSRRLARPVRLGHAVRVRRRVRWLVTSAPDGWHVEPGDGGGPVEVLDTAGLVTRLGRPGAGAVAIVCRPAHFDIGGPAPAAAGAVRALPYPFDHYLAINSDVDWSTPAQVESARRRLAEELGLPVAGSFYLGRAAPPAIAATDATGARCLGGPGEDGQSVQRWFHLGAIDTLHAWLDTMDRPPLADDERADAGARPAAGVTLDVAAVTRAIDGLVEDHVAPLVFTTHGGGHHVRRFGNLHAAAALRDAPDAARHDLDQADSPFHLRPQLHRLGVRFLSPIGGASTPKLTPLADLVQPLALADSSPAWTFRRFLSRRHETLGLPDRWRHGKNASHAAAVGFQVRDALQRLRWVDDASGGILYTHLGHTLGDQRCDRRAWPEETERGLERLAALHHPDADPDEAPAPRIWVAPAASVLLLAAVRRGVGPHLAVDGSDVRIEPWRDEGLGLDVPDLDRFGTKLLHGLTVYVDDASAARVRVGDRAVRCLVRNGPDATGRTSVTVVDDSAPRRIFIAANVIATGAEGVTATAEADAIAVTADAASGTVAWDLCPVPLAAATHWSFEIDVDARVSWELAFRDGRGAWYAAAPRGAADWSVDAAAGGRLVVLSLTARAAHPMGHPHGAVTGLRFRLADASPGGVARLRAVSLLRPHPALVPASIPRVLAGHVACDVPVAPETRERWRVRVATPDGERSTPLLPDGSFVVRELPDEVPVACRLDLGDRSIVSDRGPVAFTGADEWDWGFRVRAADLIG